MFLRKTMSYDIQRCELIKFSITDLAMTPVPVPTYVPTIDPAERTYVPYLPSLRL